GISCFSSRLVSLDSNQTSRPGQPQRRDAAPSPTAATPALRPLRAPVPHWSTPPTASPRNAPDPGRRTPGTPGRTAHPPRPRPSPLSLPGRSGGPAPRSTPGTPQAPRTPPDAG